MRLALEIFVGCLVFALGVFFGAKLMGKYVVNLVRGGKKK